MGGCCHLFSYHSSIFIYNSFGNYFHFQIGYDDVKSMAIKAQWVNTMDLGGSMVWSIEADDFRGDYGDKYPLVSTIKRIMNR